MGERDCSMTAKVIFVILMIIGVIVGLSAVNIFMKPCHDRFEMADYGNGHEILISKETIPLIMKNLDEFWRPYNVNDPKYHRCELNETPPENKTCEVNIDDFSTCKRTWGYGLNRSEPCIFFKLNADTKWMPEVIKMKDRFEELPENVNNSIENWEPMGMSAVWISCDGIQENDKSNLGSIVYIPFGFHSKYFPCKSEDLCTSPIVAVQFERLKKNVTINISCKIWANNIKEKIVFSLHVVSDHM